MKPDKILAKLLIVRDYLYKYKVVIFVIILVAIFGFMTLRIAHFSNLDPTGLQIENTQNSLTNIKLDSNAVKKINELQSQNINIESLFNNDRSNPFD